MPTLVDVRSHGVRADMRRMCIGVVMSVAAVAAVAPRGSGGLPTPVPAVPTHVSTSVASAHSSSWAGYVATTSANISSAPADSVTDVKGTWTVPNIRCTPTDTYALAWVGIDGWTNNTIEQIGTEMDCYNGGNQFFSSWWEMYPGPLTRFNWSWQPQTTKPGDQMVGEVRYLGGGQYRVTLEDITQGWSFAITQADSNGAQRSTADWIVEAPGTTGATPLTDFGAIRFSGATATISGTTGAAGRFADAKVVLYRPSGRVLARPSGMNTSGGSFRVAWRAMS